MKSTALIALAALLATGSVAAVGGPPGNPALGKQRFEATPPGGQSCASCHLESGAGAIDDSTPLLAGQHADYLAMTLRQYRSGERVNVLMNAQVAPDGTNPLTDADIENISAYLAAQRSTLHTYQPPRRR
ncbi:MAG: c-type cytochrome [Xanthomonadaceae bacterium]|jgi:cytochrome c553|nr:c-type cytochrome [Xanthomonadaceae bacterium]